MNNNFNKEYLNNLTDVLQIERNSVVLELKNDTELNKTKELTNKLSILESMIRNSIKYRNIILKQKLNS
jgi:hypothetical protein